MEWKVYRIKKSRNWINFQNEMVCIQDQVLNKVRQPLMSQESVETQFVLIIDSKERNSMMEGFFSQFAFAGVLIKIKLQ
jgi:hypothetical protein